MEVNIASVSIKRSNTNFDLVSLHQFLRIPSVERHDMIKQHMVEFIDVGGDKIKLIDGLKAITELIKQLRNEGKYMEFLNKN